jgi:hypothetical protein
MHFERHWSRLLRLDQEESQLLHTEGLIKTYPPRAFVGELYRKYPNFPRAHVHFEPKNVVVLFYVRDISKDDEFKQMCSLTGYIISRVDRSSNTKYPIQITLEPKWPGQILKNLVPTHLYHVVPSDKLHRVQSQGLAPRDSQTTFMHAGNRVYLLASQQPAKDIPALIKLLTINRQHDVDYAVLRVVTHADHAYYYDPSMQIGDMSSTCYGVFTLRNISPADIVHIMTM